MNDQKSGNLLLVIDAIINCFLGIVLLLFSEYIVDFFGLPASDTKFYPTILGAILFGIGIVLTIEYKRKDKFIGLGQGGAISINLIGGIVLFYWLISGNLKMLFQGTIIFGH
jgi:hypothetical protein